jgi:hypothetical protein
MSQRARRYVILLLAALLVAYVGSYLALSRRAFREADKIGMTDSFAFMPPEKADSWRRWHYGLLCLYSPLVLIDNLIGTGRHPMLSEPMWELGAPSTDRPSGASATAPETGALPRNR